MEEKVSVMTEKKPNFQFTVNIFSPTGNSSGITTESCVKLVYDLAQPRAHC